MYIYENIGVPFSATKEFTCAIETQVRLRGVLVYVNHDRTSQLRSPIGQMKCSQLVGGPNSDVETVWGNMALDALELEDRALILDLVSLPRWSAMGLYCIWMCFIFGQISQSQFFSKQ